MDNNVLQCEEIIFIEKMTSVIIEAEKNGKGECSDSETEHHGTSNVVHRVFLPNLSFSTSDSDSDLNVT